MKRTDDIDPTNESAETRAMTLLNDRPEVVTHKIPRIYVYHVTEDELGRLEEATAK